MVRICDECGEEFSPSEEGATETTCTICREERGSRCILCGSQWYSFFLVSATQDQWVTSGCGNAGCPNYHGQEEA